MISTRISHTLPAAARDKAASTLLRPLTVLNVLFKYASARGSFARLVACFAWSLLACLATERCEKRGLMPELGQFGRALAMVGNDARGRIRQLLASLGAA
jgi:hypothetical protein